MAAMAGCGRLTGPFRVVGIAYSDNKAEAEYEVQIGTERGREFRRWWRGVAKRGARLE